MVVPLRAIAEAALEVKPVPSTRHKRFCRLVCCRSRKRFRLLHFGCRCCSGESKTDGLQTVYQIICWYSKKGGAQAFEIGTAQCLHVLLNSRIVLQYRQYHPILPRSALTCTGVPSCPTVASSPISIGCLVDISGQPLYLDSVVCLAGFRTVVPINSTIHSL